MSLVKILSLLAVALLAGGWMMGTMLVVPAQRELSASVYTAAEQANTSFGQRYFPVVVGTAIVSLVALLVLDRKQRHLGTGLIGASLLLVVAAAVLTAVWMLPLNAEVDSWSVEAPPRDWQDTRDAWHSGQAIRTFMAVPAFVLLATALVRARQPGSGAELPSPTPPPE